MTAFFFLQCVVSGSPKRTGVCRLNTRWTYTAGGARVHFEFQEWPDPPRPHSSIRSRSTEQVRSAPGGYRKAGTYWSLRAGYPRGLASEPFASHTLWGTLGVHLSPWSWAVLCPGSPHTSTLRQSTGHARSFLLPCMMGQKGCRVLAHSPGS